VAPKGHFGSGAILGYEVAMRLVCSLIAALGVGGACNRVEEPSSPGPQPVETSTGPTLTSAPVAPPAPTPAPTRCLVEPPAQPPAPAAPAASCPKDPTGPLALPKGSVTFPAAPGQPKLEVEIAGEDAARTRGLMYRTSMPENHGMIFSWDDERIRSFWMKNTCLPLDMLFIAADGTIVGILEQVPTLNLAARSVRCPAAHVLEVNAGWTRSHGIKVGSKAVIQG
jgi:uncharacterized membrane protein (UPF0127 family)